MNTSVYSLYLLSFSLIIVFLVPLTCFFALKFMLSGFSSPEKRSQLKETLSGFVSFLISVPLGYLFYAILVKLSHLISLYLIGSSFAIETLPNFSSSLQHVLASATLISAYKFGSMLSLITISMQRILLVFGAVILPVSLAFIFIGSGSFKNLGQSLLTFSVMIIFMPIVDSLIFQCAELAIPAAESAEFIVVSSYWLVGLVNLLIFFAAFSVSKTGSGVTLIRNIIKKG